MVSEYRLRRRVQFYETDAAGIVHFSWFFRYMEEAEHALWREAGLSIAHMRSPGGWVEPGQTPQFDEFTIVLKGMLRVAYRGGALEVRAGQAVIAHAEEWVQYSTPEDDGAEYIAVCLPAFSMETVHRDAD